MAKSIAPPIVPPGPPRAPGTSLTDPYGIKTQQKYLSRTAPGPFALYGDKKRGLTNEFYFSGESLEALSRDLNAAARALAREAAPLLMEIGEEVETRAKKIAADNGSTSIPPTIHGRLTNPYEYRIQAGGPESAIAGLWELGNRRNTGTGKGGRIPVYETGKDVFWHPVFGREPSVPQKRHPFLRPALAADRANITKRMHSMWDRALGPYRLAPDVFGVGSVMPISEGDFTSTPESLP